MKFLDLDTWPRRAQFELFRRYELPFFNVCAEVEVSVSSAGRRVLREERAEAFEHAVIVDLAGVSIGRESIEDRLCVLGGLSALIQREVGVERGESLRSAERDRHPRSLVNGELVSDVRQRRPISSWIVVLSLGWL
ncbi:MAG: hypothetical protein H6705_04060 [Myxococcales bacterium]|nr:hypothetical protein [Myxococcales bacterium]